MPFRSYADKEAFKLAVKDAGAQGKLGVMAMRGGMGEESGSAFAICAMGHGLNMLISGWLNKAPIRSSPSLEAELIGLTQFESINIFNANDHSYPEERAEKVCEVVESIGVG